MSVTKRSEKKGTALDLLEMEDLELRQLLTALGNTRGPSVGEWSEYCDIAKEAIRQLATHEAALVDVREVASEHPALREVSDRFEGAMLEHRPHIDRVEKMSRGVQGINLRVG
jgi:hypothetical protein